MSTLRDVVVVGGGPAGCATAILLQQQGHDVVLIDEAVFPRDKVCGESVSPEAWRLFGLIGAREAVRALHPYALHGMTLVSSCGTACRGTYHRDGDELGLALRRDALDHALLQIARESGVEVREETRARSIELGEGRVKGVLIHDAKGPSRIEARLVVGADGRRSVVARRLGLLREHRTWRRFAVRGHWHGMQALGPWGEMHGSANGGYCGVAPLGPDRANVTFVLDRCEMADASTGLESFYRRQLWTRWPRLADRLQKAELITPPKAIGPLALVTRRLSVPGALLVGDAAGFYDPFTGEGVTLALRSAELAATVAGRALTLNTTDDLSAYDRLRHAATRDKFRLNRILQYVVSWPSLADAVARRLAGRPDLADRLVGIAGDLVPARSAFGPKFVWDLLTG
jgi:geranylgeranyl reductase family protein